MTGARPSPQTLNSTKRRLLASRLSSAAGSPGVGGVGVEASPESVALDGFPRVERVSVGCRSRSHAPGSTWSRPLRDAQGSRSCATAHPPGSPTHVHRASATAREALTGQAVVSGSGHLRPS